MTAWVAMRAHLHRARPSVAPWSVWLLAGLWYVQGATLLVVGLGADVLPDGGGMFGSDYVAAELSRPVGALLVLLALVTFVGEVLVVLGQGFALPGLFAAGLAGMVVLAVASSWAALVLPVVMLLAALLVVTTGALEHLFPSAEEGSEGVR